MIEHDVDIPTAHGLMNTFVTRPEEGGPHPVVLFYMDAPGKREELHDMARRLGTAGYYVILPNLYYRATREFNVFSGEAEATRERMFELMGSLDDDLIASDTAALMSYVDDDPAADASRMGCVGYCMSGPFSFAMAAHYPDRIKAAASIYGVRLFGEGSPAPLADRVRGELYFACAEQDDYAPKDMIDGLEAHLRAVGANARVEWYPGTHHGFAFPTRGPVYDKPGAERHWERLHALFRRNLG
ncbi:MAG: dienelactone hydrolase family protein [Acidimicrobiales bacterium]